MVRVLISPCKRNWHSGGKIAMLVLEQMDGGTFAIAHTLGGATSRGIPFAAARVGVRFPQSTDGGWKSARSGRFSRHLRRARNFDFPKVPGRPNCPYCKKAAGVGLRSEEHTSELQSQSNLVCRLLLEKRNLPRLVSDLH